MCARELPGCPLLQFGKYREPPQLPSSLTLCAQLCVCFPFSDRQLNKRRINAIRAELVGVLNFRVLGA